YQLAAQKLHGHLADLLRLEISPIQNWNRIPIFRLRRWNSAPRFKWLIHKGIQQLTCHGAKIRWVLGYATGVRNQPIQPGLYLIGRANYPRWLLDFISAEPHSPFQLLLHPDPSHTLAKIQYFL